jgi:hypothetical protein
VVGDRAVDIVPLAGAMALFAERNRDVSDLADLDWSSTVALD